MTVKEERGIEREILHLLERRGEGKTICPSEVARNLYPDTWRDQMSLIHRLTSKLREEGKVVITQGGAEIKTVYPVGPYRIKMRRQ